MQQQLSGYEWERIDALNGYTLSLNDFKQRGFTPFSQWIDPMLGRNHTNTDLAAMISHYKAWEKCIELDCPVLILEDDAERIDNLDLAEVEDLLNTYDVVYLDHREMVPDEIKHVNDRFFKPYYPYWNSAYAISPSTAKKIIELSNYKNNLIPVDEFFPSLFNVDYNRYCLSNNINVKNNFINLQRIFTSKFSLTPIAYSNKVFKQKPRSELGSDIERGVIMSTIENTHLITVATDITRLDETEPG